MTNTAPEEILLSPIKLTAIEALIENSVRRAFSAIENKKSEDEILTLDEACEFLNLQRPTVYTMTSKREIPFIKKAKKLYFSKQDLTAWLKSSSRRVKQLDASL